MINWKEIDKLDIISRFRELLKRRFSVEVILVDNKGIIRSKGHNFNSIFTKVYKNLQNNYFDYSISKIVNHVKNSSKPYLVCNLYESIKCLVVKIVIDEYFQGVVISVPFFEDDVHDKTNNSLNNYCISENNYHNVINSIKKLSNVDKEYLKDFSILVAEEIQAFYDTISKREKKIKTHSLELVDRFRYHSMIGKSKQMQNIYQLLDKLSNSDSNIFIQGENGTGKELVAKAIHYFSCRKENNFLAVNCSAFNDALLDSELFGHVKGSFTGAIRDKKGLFLQADGGTLFLDEIGDTSINMQAKLLRFLQDGTCFPVGSTTPIHCNVRIVAATNKDIKSMLKNGEFREDLYYRVNVININLPPLREREGDISILVNHFLKNKCDDAGCSIKAISNKCMEKLLDYNWPGNIRELENEIERLVILSGNNDTITSELLSPRIANKDKYINKFSTMGINTKGTLKSALEELEYIIIQEGLTNCNFNKSRLSKKLGISRANLISKIARYGLDKRKKVA